MLLAVSLGVVQGAVQEAQLVALQWKDRKVVEVANKHCDGRIVSCLEGGYRIHGNVVSGFARSIAAHVRGLAAPAVRPLVGDVATRRGRPECFRGGPLSQKATPSIACGPNQQGEFPP